MVLHDLAGGVEGEGVEEGYVSGDLEAGHAGLRPGSELLRGDGCAGLADNEGLASTMEELQAFYDAAFPLLDKANKYLEQFPLAGGLPEPERNLLLLMMSLVLVSFPVEVWQQPRVPDSGSAYLDLVVEPRV